MTKAKNTVGKFSLDGKGSGSIEVAEGLISAKANNQMVKDYIIALRANARQWSANTKGRSEVNHTTKKPHPQKGGGRARQGSLAAPQYKGGGRVFGPKPKFNQHVKVNKKEKAAAIRFLIGEKLRNEKVIILEDAVVHHRVPKTKTVADFLESRGLTGKRVLFLGESEHKKAESPGEHHKKFVKSMRNIPKTAFALAVNVNGYDLVLADHIIVTAKAMEELEARLGQGVE